MGGSRSAASEISTLACTHTRRCATSSTFASTTRSENPSLLGLGFKSENPQSRRHVRELLAEKHFPYFWFWLCLYGFRLLISSGFWRLVLGFSLLILSYLIWALEVSFGNNKKILIDFIWIWLIVDLGGFILSSLMWVLYWVFVKDVVRTICLSKLLWETWVIELHNVACGCKRRWRSETTHFVAAATSCGGYCG